VSAHRWPGKADKPRAISQAFFDSLWKTCGNPAKPAQAPMEFLAISRGRTHYITGSYTDCVLIFMNLSGNHNISLWKTCGKTWKICGKPVEKPPKLLTGINTLWKSGQVIHSFSTGGE
jgi:hypothetical protein